MLARGVFRGACGRGSAFVSRHPGRCRRSLGSNEIAAFLESVRNGCGLESPINTVRKKSLEIHDRHGCRIIRIFFRLSIQNAGSRPASERNARRSRPGVLKRREERPELQPWGAGGLQSKGGKGARSARTSLPLRTPGRLRRTICPHNKALENKVSFRTGSF